MLYTIYTICLLFALYIIQTAIATSIHCTLYNELCTNELCTMNCVQNTSYDVRQTIYLVQCTTYSVHLQYTSYSARI